MSIIKLADIRHELAAFRENGMPKGFDPGWDCLAEFYRPEPGYMSVVTGIPGHGKSEWLDALMVNLALAHDWKFAVFSPENFPVAFHFNKLVEKFCGTSHDLVPPEDYQEGCEFIDEHFTFIYPPEDKTTVGDVLAIFKRVKDNFGADGFVIDPWNELDHKRPAVFSETEYISQSLTKIRRFCREERLHGWLVAHPTKLLKDKDGRYPPPTPYDISGSSHWRNKADYCITVHRPEIRENWLQVHVQKVKFKHFGKLGMVEFGYDYRSGRMNKRGDRDFTLPRRIE